MIQKEDGNVLFEKHDIIVMNNGLKCTFKEYATMFGCNIFVTNEYLGKESYQLVSQIDLQKSIAINVNRTYRNTKEDVHNLNLRKLLLDYWHVEGIKKVIKSNHRVRMYRGENFTPIELFYDINHLVFVCMEDLNTNNKIEDVIYDVKDLLQVTNNELSKLEVK